MELSENIPNFNGSVHKQVWLDDPVWFDVRENVERLAAVPDLFTVGLVVRYVEWKLGQRVEVGPNRAQTISVPSNASSMHRE